MPEGRANASGSGLAARVRAWWDASTFLGDVALLFTIVTVGNSVMMLAGLDEPKTGSFAHVHLLGRLGIIASIVGLFHLQDVRERFARRSREAREPDLPLAAGRPPRVVEAVLGSVLRSGLDGTARVFTAAVAVTGVVSLALAGVRPPAGGRELYRNLVLLAVALVPIRFVASRAWRQRTVGSPAR